MECPIPVPPPDEGEEECDVASNQMEAPTWCENCFVSSEVFHDHITFCMVDERGIHKEVTRTVGITPRYTLRREDMICLPVSLPSQSQCMSCYEDFVAHNPPCSPPGCRKQHSHGVMVDKERGMIDTGGYIHVECALEYYIAIGLGSYCGVERKLYFPPYCRMCMFEKEMDLWRIEFQEIYALVSQPFSKDSPEVAKNEMESVLAHPKLAPLAIPLTDVTLTKEDMLLLVENSLCSLHKQPWIQKVASDVKFEFSDA